MAQLAWYETAHGRQRAADILAMRAKGMTEAAIAEKLGVTTQTVSNFIHRLKQIGLPEATSFAEVDRIMREAELREAVLGIASNILSLDASPQEKENKLVQLAKDYADRLSGRGQKATKDPAPVSPVKGYIDDLARPRQRKETAASKELRESSNSAAKYAADLLEGP